MAHTMGDKECNQHFLKRWEHLDLKERQQTPPLTPSLKAEIKRQQLHQLQFARVSKLIDHDGSNGLELNYADKYHKIMDLPELQKGVNNYAEETLALLSGKTNDSKRWTTSLSVEKVKSWSCVKKYLETAKAAVASVIPPGKENEIVATNSDKQATQTIVVPNVSNSKDDKMMSSLGVDQNLGQCVGNKLNQGQSAGQFTFRKDTRNHPPKVAPTRQNNTHQGVFHQQPENNFVPDVNNRCNDRTQSVNVPPNRNPQNLFQNQNSDLYSFAKRGQSSSNDFGGPKRNSNGSGFMNQRQNTGGGNGNFEEDYGNQLPFRNQNKQKQIIYPSKGPNPYERDDRRVENQQQFPLYRRVEPVKRSYQDTFNQEKEDENENDNPSFGNFKTARDQLAIDNQKKFGRNRGSGNQGQSSSLSYGAGKKSLGARRGPSSKFVPPVFNKDGQEPGPSRNSGNAKSNEENDEPVDERLKGIDPKMIEMISNEIMDHGPPIAWDDIAGLEFAKNTIKEIVVWPMLRPDIFTGLRGPPKGLLLFGPPGTGKTLIGKCIASQSKSTFFSISASSLTSKWVGEGEKMVRALFGVARVHEPAVIFIDEIDSLLSQRTDGEHEASRRIKTEFLVQLDGATTSGDERILVVGATNRPQEIDEAARRRFVKRLYIPLPEGLARKQIVLNLMTQQKYQLSDQEIDVITEKTAGYSGADMSNLCREAALGPIRSISLADIENITSDQVRAIEFQDFDDALRQVRASVSEKDLDVYLDWNSQYGSWGIPHV